MLIICTDLKVQMNRFNSYLIKKNVQKRPLILLLPYIALKVIGYSVMIVYQDSNIDFLM